mgnify:CR=1 FL=1
MPHGTGCQMGELMTGEANNSYHILAKAFLANHASVMEIDLKTGQALIIKHQLEPELEGRMLPWSEFITDCVAKHVHPLDQEQMGALSLERLRQYCLDGKGDFPMQVRCRLDAEEIQWMSLSVTCAGPDSDTAIVASRNVDETMMIRKIVDLFIYQNYDYLYLINAKKDSYIRFTGSKEHTPLPPEKGDHYTDDMVRYNRQFVAPEDYERVTANMQIPHIIQMLEQSEIYSFTSGGITTEGNYRRSRVVFLYYDKTAGQILMARTDVTQIYLEEQEKNRQLAEALRSAKHDPMTGVYNQKATGELISRSLQGQYRTMAAILFVDVDNFKKVNDTCGHPKGDELLCFLAESLEEIAGRDGTDYDTLLRKADEALYTAKRYGKNQYYFYSC